MPILITGASGFLGSRLLARLAADGQDCYALSRHPHPLPPRAHFLPADLRDPHHILDTISSLRPRVIYHCAMTSGHPNSPAQHLESLQTSVLGTAVLAEAAAASGVQRFVFTGSFLVYRPQRRALVESDPVEPHSLRGAAKAGAALWLRQFALSQSFPAVELRIFSIYGPGEPTHRFIPSLLRAARHATTLPLLPGPSHDFVHVDDVVDACLLAASRPYSPGTVFNIAGGQAFTNEQVVESASRALALPIHVNPHAYPPSPADAPFWLADISAAASGLGWKPTHSLENGLRQMDRESCLTSV